MPNSPDWYNSSAHCRPSGNAVGARLEWRPSRWLVSGLVLLGLMAAISAIHSDLPAGISWPVALVATVYGGWLARRESSKSPLQLVITDETRVYIDDLEVTEFLVHWRGPLAFARWCDARGRVQRLTWWPDTLPASARRELRLAAPAGVAARHTGSMAT